MQDKNERTRLRRDVGLLNVMLVGIRSSEIYALYIIYIVEIAGLHIRALLQQQPHPQPQQQQKQP